MSTTPETGLCECEECLALRAAEDGSGETVAAFDHDGSSYEIDHLGIGSASQWGEFEVYCDGEEVARFTLVQSVLRPAGRPVSVDELVRLARQAVTGRTGRDNPAGGRRPGPLPARLRPLPAALRSAWPRSYRPSPPRPRPGPRRGTQLIPGLAPVTRIGTGS